MQLAPRRRIIPIKTRRKRGKGPLFSACDRYYPSAPCGKFCEEYYSHEMLLITAQTKVRKWGRLHSYTVEREGGTDKDNWLLKDTDQILGLVVRPCLCT
jgi:hypothetical protein